MELTTNNLQGLFSIRGFMSIIEILVVIVMVLYIIFAFILHRQIKMMNKSFSTPQAPLLSMAGIFHLMLSLVVAALALLSVMAR